MTLDLQLLDPDDERQLDAIVELFAATDAVDAPWRHGATRRSIRQEHLLGYDGDPEPFYLIHRGSDLVAVGAMALPSRDNLDSGWIYAAVHPDARRQGIGRWTYTELIRLATDAGRTVLGTFGVDLPHTRGFVDAIGFEVRSRSVTRRVTFAELPAGATEAAYAQALPYAADYDHLRVVGALPADLMAGYVQAVAAINDAPTDDLEQEDEVFDAERVRAYERSHAVRGETLYRVIARHRETGEFAGHTVVTVDPERPTFGDQHDTTVVDAHRGHRLGVLLKTDMVRWLGEVEPACGMLTTSNAESNTHMIAVNDLLGYRPISHGIACQRTPSSPAV